MDTSLGYEQALTALNNRPAVQPRGQSPEAIKAAADEFEAMFLAQMLAPMFESIGTDGMFGGGKGEEVFRSLLVDEYGKEIVRNGGLGISAEIQRAMIEYQEMQQGGHRVK